MENQEFEKMGVRCMDTNEMTDINGGILLGGFPWAQAFKFIADNWSEIKNGLAEGWKAENF